MLALLLCWKSFSAPTLVAGLVALRVGLKFQIGTCCSMRQALEMQPWYRGIGLRQLLLMTVETCRKLETEVSCGQAWHVQGLCLRL